MTDSSAFHVEPWAEGDLPLLEQLMGDPKMAEHLGGPESPEQIAKRQARYELPERAKSKGTRRFKHAFPSVDSAPSNAICQKLGFRLLGEAEFEYPQGNLIPSNDWRLDLVGAD